MVRSFISIFRTTSINIGQYYEFTKRNSSFIITIILIKPKASDTSEGMGISLPEDKIKYLEGQTQSLQFQLAQRSESTASITEQYQAMKQSLNEMDEKLEEEKKLTNHLTRDMTRQYKGMQDELLNKITKRDETIQNLMDKIQQDEMKKRKAFEEKDSIIQEKQKCIKSLEQKMEEQCALFAKMLKDAIDQMKERIEVQSASSDEKSVPIQHRLEEFKFSTSNSSGLR